MKKHAADKLIKIAKKYKPRGVFIRFRKDCYLTPAHAAILHDGSKILYVPRPESREALFIFLHECAHHHLGHCKLGYREPLWRQEFEAERWAIKTMREEGLCVPRSMIAEAKRYVAECADEDLRKNRVGPTYEVYAWMNRKFKKRPKLVANYRKPKKK
jgi:hypothetical protein